MMHGWVSRRLGHMTAVFSDTASHLLLRLGCRLGIRGCRRQPPRSWSGWMSAPFAVDDCLGQSRPWAVLDGRCGCTYRTLAVGGCTPSGTIIAV